MVTLLATLAAALGPMPAQAPVERAALRAPQFEASIAKLDREQRKRMRPGVWRPGCPVPLRRLRLIRTTHFDFDREVETGRLVVHKREAGELVRTMRALFEARFPIRRMQPIERYDGSDHRSMDADNTSAFNCRFVAGTSRWSEHAYGLAVDINPRENPYVSGSHVSPPAGRPYADRSPKRKGMIGRRDPVFRAFKRIGWEWGGLWRPARDYQHFSERGR